LSRKSAVIVARSSRLHEICGPEAISKAAETDKDSSELYESEIAFVINFVPGFNAAKILQTGEKARYFPSSIAAAKSLSICEN
jgi:hypothetical protein